MDRTALGSHLTSSPVVLLLFTPLWAHRLLCCSMNSEAHTWSQAPCWNILLLPRCLLDTAQILLSQHNLYDPILWILLSDFLLLCKSSVNWLRGSNPSTRYPASFHRRTPASTSLFGDPSMWPVSTGSEKGKERMRGHICFKQPWPRSNTDHLQRNSAGKN